MQGASSCAQSLLVLAASAVLFGYLSMRLLISRIAKVISRIFQTMELPGKARHHAEYFLGNLLWSDMRSARG
jgi:hypothetical protein